MATVGRDKAANVQHAVSTIRRAVTESESSGQPRPRIVALPECFNSPYGTKYFAEYAETVPDGYTSQQLSSVARELGIYVIGGSIPERDGSADDATAKLYNTCTVWSPAGELLAKYRKMHLFDIDVVGGMRFKESDVLSAGAEFRTVTVDGCKLGLGICYDIRFEEHARVYRNMGCDALLYPAAFNMTTGPLHWELLQRARANDLQLWVATISPARNADAEYVAWGHSMVVDPWGKVVAGGDRTDETIVYADIEVGLNARVREQIPVSKQRRLDMYETTQK